MKQLLFPVLVLLCISANANGNELSPADALAEFQRMIVPTDQAAGFHAIEMPKQREFAAAVPVTADAECLRFAIETGRGHKPMCRKHADINKVIVRSIQDGRWFKEAYPGDYLVMVFYKGAGKLALLSLSAEDVDPFLDAVNVLAPDIKKIKDTR